MDLRLLERLSLTGFIRSDMDKLAREKYCTGQYYKHVMIINDNSISLNKRSFKLIDDARVIIYDRNRFIIQSAASVTKVKKAF